MKNKVTLYIATHNKSGLKYFGKTTRYFNVEDLQKSYHGSGIYWRNHLKTHGNDVTMEIFKICSLIETEIDFVTPIAIKFSKENDIVRSNIWANSKIEDGFEGGSLSGELHPCFGKSISSEHKKVISDANKGKPKSDEHKQKIREAATGRILSDETKLKLSKLNSGENNPFYGKTHSKETLEKLKYAKTEEHKEKLRIRGKEKLKCSYCEKEGGRYAMKRWHFDNCKSKEGNK